MVLREDDIRRPDGSLGIYGVVDKPDYALVMPFDGHRFRLVEQFRYPLGARRWEFPQGNAPGLADTDPSELAERELREETGLSASSFEVLGQLDVAAGMSSQRGWVFLATGIAEGEPDLEARGTGPAQCMVRSRGRRADDPVRSDRRRAVGRRLQPVPAAAPMNSAGTRRVPAL